MYVRNNPCNNPKLCTSLGCVSSIPILRQCFTTGSSSTIKCLNNIQAMLHSVKTSVQLLWSPRLQACQPCLPSWTLLSTLIMHLTKAQDNCTKHQLFSKIGNLSFVFRVGCTVSCTYEPSPLAMYKCTPRPV